MTEYFKKGQWVVRVKGYSNDTDSAEIGDLRQVDEDDSLIPFVSHINADGRQDIITASEYRPATPEEIARYLGEEREGMEKQTTHSAPPTGGLSGHYLAEVPEPQRGGPSYTAECDDIIFALNMTFDEGEAFKAIWRTCTSRLGYGKEGNTALYNAQKLVHRAGRILKREKGE